MTANEILALPRELSNSSDSSTSASSMMEHDIISAFM